MPVDREADHLQIKALTECLSFPLKLVYVDRSEGGPTELVIPDGSSPDVSLLYRPGSFNSTGWPKSNVSKVRAYYSASDHLIHKNFSGVCWVSHWFEEYLKIIKIGDYFFE